MELKKLRRELIRTIVSTDTIYEITKVDLGSRGQTKNLNKRRHLSELHSKRNSLRRGHI